MKDKSLTKNEEKRRKIQEKSWKKYYKSLQINKKNSTKMKKKKTTKVKK